MARSYRYLHYDVFTDHIFGGNQLAVVLDARGLSGETMQAIAKEMSFSETTFLLPRERPDTDIRMRIFTPAEELPVAGHPTIGSTFALARSGVIPQGQDWFTFGLGIGPTPVALTWKDGDLSFAWMSQVKPIFGEPLSGSIPGRAAAALSVPADTVTGTRCPIQVVSCGVPFLFVPLTTRRAVDEAAVNREALDALLSSSKSATMSSAYGVFLFSAERASDEATVYSRMFAPALGVAEDPATGSASGPLGCYLVEHKIVSAENAAAMLSLQGVKMGRPSYVHISIGTEKGDNSAPSDIRITSVRVGGEAVLAGEGILYI